ncbi:MAG: sugar transferase [Bacteroidota bacterium]
MSLTIEKYLVRIDFNKDKDFFIKSYSLNYFNYLQMSSKRAFDLLICFLFFAILGWWLFPIIALLIKLGSNGPVLFKQLRHGKNNRPFYCYKFRTMKFELKEEFQQARKNDSRITGIGQLLRKTSLDELPQLFNIILGEMSVVGPRPHELTMNREYKTHYSYFMCRHYVKPGVTGLAQCKGYRGEIRDYMDMKFRLRFDLLYIKKWSIFLDLYIIILTIKCLLFNNNNAY